MPIQPRRKPISSETGDLVLSGEIDPKCEITLQTQQVLMACLESAKQDGAGTLDGFIRCRR